LVLVVSETTHQTQMVVMGQTLFSVLLLQRVVVVVVTGPIREVVAVLVVAVEVMRLLLRVLVRRIRAMQVALRVRSLVEMRLLAAAVLVLLALI
jgi:hypothetical protein